MVTRFAERSHLPTGHGDAPQDLPPPLPPAPRRSLVLDSSTMRTEDAAGDAALPNAKPEADAIPGSTELPALGLPAVLPRNRSPWRQGKAAREQTQGVLSAGPSA